MQKRGILRCKLKGWIYKGGHYANEKVDEKGGIMTWKLRVDGKGWTLCGKKMVDAKGDIIMWKLKMLMDKGGYYDVQI